MLPRLKQRREFLRAASGGRKSVARGLVLQARRRRTGDRPPVDVPGPRLGITDSKKVGKAVTRNRARRRLRAAAEAILPRHAEPGHDYVLIGRAETPTRPFRSLIGDLESALKRLKLFRDMEAGR